jgi:hypothetical protein
VQRRTRRCSGRRPVSGFAGPLSRAGAAAESCVRPLFIAVIETNGSEAPMAVPATDLTITFEAPRGAPTASFAPGSRGPRSGFEEELCRLLRSRLILIHLLALAVVLLLAVLSFVGPSGREDASLRPDQGNPWRLAPLLVECVVGALVLWRRPGMSLWSLRDQRHERPAAVQLPCGRVQLPVRRRLGALPPPGHKHPRAGRPGHPGRRRSRLGGGLLARALFLTCRRLHPGDLGAAPALCCPCPRPSRGDFLAAQTAF